LIEEIYLIVGSDSGFEGYTKIVYTKLDYFIKEKKRKELKEVKYLVIY